MGKAGFIQMYCNRGQENYNRGERLKSTLKQKLREFESAGVI